MGIPSLQVCMDDSSSDWFQGAIHEELGVMDSPSSPSPIVDILARPPGLMERRLRPPHDLSLKCPRCDSTNTKFCYYNNYSLTQPRYFCKTCRRYWTKGGTLRNIPVGGGCRKNKKVVTKKSSEQSPSPSSLSPSSSSFVQGNGPGATDLQLSAGLPFPVEMQLSYLMGDHAGNTGFMGGRYNGMFEFMDGKYDQTLVEGSASRSYDFMGNSGDHMGLIGGINNNEMGLGPNFHALCPPPFGMSFDENVINGPNSLLETNNGTTTQRLLLPPNFTNPNFTNPSDDNNQLVEVKPNPKILALGWQDQPCFDAGKDSYGSYANGMGSWPSLMNGYGSSTSTNPMV